MLEFATQWVKDNIKREQGQAMAEYAVILALVSIVAIAVLVILGPKIADALRSVYDAL